ncbi:LPXTG-motif cell wall anchor domain-containing protein [Filibacter tadaridae]|uniref:Uncharacterized protein n=1 Tax=Filibacter tadaridae TaxID=2483811 RepID=A0A3P5WEW6_9BACL|nr:hypothetical protein FILTAD_00014 [Filibacter tadaridae]
MRTKVFEWIGFIIVCVSIIIHSIFRANGITTGMGINLSVIGIVLGAILAFTFFFIRKSRNNKGQKKSYN